MGGKIVIKSQRFAKTAVDREAGESGRDAIGMVAIHVRDASFVRPRCYLPNGRDASELGDF